MNITRAFVFFVLLLQAVATHTNMSDAAASKTSTITIWVHGSRLLEFIKERHESPPGLHQAKNLPYTYRLKAVAYLLSAAAPMKFSLDDFYTFGWNGKISGLARKKASLLLYKEIKQLVEQFRKTHDGPPKIRIISHSHGGNVALLLAEIAQEKKDTTFSIDELILIACPVQEVTATYASSSIFKKIYTMFSNQDILQIVDPQILQLTNEKNRKLLVFSQRFFPVQPNLVQAQIVFSNRWFKGPFHIDFLVDDAFVMQIPEVLDQMSTSAEEKMTVKIA